MRLHIKILLFVLGSLLLVGIFAFLSGRASLSGGNSTINTLGTKTFLGLSDTPDSYSGQAGNCAQVNGGETGLTFGSCGTGSGGGISNLNGLTNSSQTFATGTVGNDFSIGSSGSTHTFNLPTASSMKRGLLSSADWVTFNAKQAALGFTPANQATTFTINGAAQDLSANRTWSVGTLTALSVASANGFGGSSSGGATPALTLTTSCNGVCKGNGTAISTASNGTDYTLITANSCSAGNHLATVSAAGAFTCTADTTDTTSTLGTLIQGATAKTTPVDADLFALADSAASWLVKNLSWANIKATLKTYFDTLYSPRIQSKTFTMTNPTAASTGRIGLWRVNATTTISGVHFLVKGGSSSQVVGQLADYGANGSTAGSKIDSSDITGLQDTNVNDDGALSSPIIPAGDYLGVYITSVTGTPVNLMVSFEYTQ